MSRSAKQFFYGALYLALAVLVVISVFPDRDAAEIPAPAPEGIRGLEVRGAVTTMTAADGIVAFLARVRNPNTTHTASSFPYSFRVVRGAVTVFETPRRNGFVYPLETSVLLETIPSISLTEDTLVTLETGAPVWESSEFLVRPALSVSHAETSSDEIGAFIDGEITNPGAISASAVRIIAIIKDVNGFPLFAAQTLLENIPGEALRPFFIRFPRDRGIPERAAPDGTELVVEAW